MPSPLAATARPFDVALAGPHPPRRGGDVLAEVRLPLVLQLHRRGVRVSVETPKPAAEQRERGTVTADRVLTTVLMTDLVDSTTHAATAGDRSWRATLDRHDALVREELDRFGGREVKSLGDGVLAVFDGPCGAIGCARAIGAGVRALGLRSRAGVHTGEVELRGLDIAGLAVHVGARIAALAKADEVLVSSVVPLLVGGSGLGFSDRGEHQLKGVPGSWRLFAVR